MQLRINIRRAKLLIWLVSAAAFAFAGWTFYDIFTQKQAKHYEPRTRDFFKTQVLLVNVHNQPQATKKAFYKPEDYEKLWDVLIDGSIREKPKGPEDTPVAVEEKPKAPPIDSVVQVGLIVWAPEPALRFAAITYKTGAGGAAAAPAPAAGAAGAAAASAAATVSGKENRLHLSEGDPLQPPYCDPPCNGKVLRIDQQEVTFQWGDGEATVTPNLGRDGSGKPLRLFEVPPPDADPADAVAAAPAETTKLKEGHWIIGTNDRDRAGKDLQGFLDQEINVRTITPSGGGHSSLEITGVKPNSLAAQFGAQNGDRILSVNGIPMNSMSGAVNWFKQNSDLPAYVVIFERNGKQDSLTFHVK